MTEQSIERINAAVDTRLMAPNPFRLGRQRQPSGMIAIEDEDGEIITYVHPPEAFVTRAKRLGLDDVEHAPLYLALTSVFAKAYELGLQHGRSCGKVETQEAVKRALGIEG